MFGSPSRKFFKAAISNDLAGLDACFTWEIPEKYGINARDARGKTALAIAAGAGQIEAVRKLIDKGADLEAADKEGRTALFDATEAGRGAIVKMLLDAGAKPNTHSNEYTCPLHWAAHNGDIDSLQALIAAGAEVNARNQKEERTPLYYAVASNRGPAAEILLAAGARTDLPGTDGVTDYDYAKVNNARILKLMDDAAAKPKAGAAATPPAPAAATEENGSGWILMDSAKAAHVGIYPQLNRKITEIFNFESRERLIITENLKTGAETMGAPEKFEAISEAAIAAATEQLQKLGGSLPDPKAKRSFNL